MRVLVISDVHGVKTNLEKIRDRYIQLKCDKLIVLGDLYWGNNGIDYDPKYVRKFLESFKDNLICIKGNCDFQVDLEEEPYPIEKDNVINIERNIYVTHGHMYNEKNWIIENSILIFGHYHIPFIEEIGSNIFINPGSISKPRSENLPSYLLINENEFTIFDVNDSVIASIKVSQNK